MKKILTYIITLAVFCTIPTSTLANENQNISTEKVVISKTPYILRLTMLLIQNLNTEYDFNKIENKQNIESQKLTKRFDSKTKKVIYKVNTIVGSDDTGYDNVVFEYIP